MGKMLSLLEPDFSFKDDRGFLFQLVKDGWKQVNVSQSLKGALRGGHYHKETREAFFIVEGSLDLRLERDAEEENYSFKAGDFFVIEPYAVHYMKFTADTLIVALYDVAVERPDGSKDIFKKGE